jgi:YjbE family integral membrane protein
MEALLTAMVTPEFWLAVGQIVMIDILLGGDNAVVIALACRNLPPELRKKGIIWGTVGAIVLRVVLIFFAMSLLKLPYLKLIGALLLLWIGIQLLGPDDDDHGNLKASDKLLGAIKTIIVADFVMSVDNVIGIAGAAQGAGHAGHEMPLVIFGLLVSIPIIVWGSTLVLKLMDRFPIIITGGGMLLGWIAGTLAVTDPALQAHVPEAESMRYLAGGLGALLVLVVGSALARRTQPET